jgi:hypothetical protein
MTLPNHVAEKIAIEVIRTLVGRFENFPEDSSNNRNAPFHEAFLNAFENKLNDKVSDIPFFISLSSWMHGLNTTLGQSFFENVAHILSDGSKVSYTSKNGNLLNVTKSQKENIADIITNLKNSTSTPNLADENEKIFDASEDDLIEANSFTVDVYYEDDDSITCVELKTVKPNAGEMRGEKQKILEGKAALFIANSQKEIDYLIGFPFDPLSDEATTFDKTNFLNSIIDGKKYFAEDEVKLSAELWDFLSGNTNTMESILVIINKIATTEFYDKYLFINDLNNINEPEYISILQDWYLFSEVNLVNNLTQIKEMLKSNKKLVRVFNQKPFCIKGTNIIYNQNRFDKLMHE